MSPRTTLFHLMSVELIDHKKAYWLSIGKGQQEDPATTQEGRVSSPLWWVNMEKYQMRFHLTLINIPERPGAHIPNSWLKDLGPISPAVGQRTWSLYRPTVGWRTWHLYTQQLSEKPETCIPQQLAEGYGTHILKSWLKDASKKPLGRIWTR